MRIRGSRLFAATAIILLASSCQPSGQSLTTAGHSRAADAAKIRATAEKWKSAIGRRDIDTVANFYTDDAWVLPEVGEVSRTAQARREYWQAIALLPIVADTVDVADNVEVARSGDLAIQYGEFRQLYADNAGNTSSLPQKFITVWRKQPDSSWKVSANMSTVRNVVPK